MKIIIKKNNKIKNAVLRLGVMEWDGQVASKPFSCHVKKTLFSYNARNDVRFIIVITICHNAPFYSLVLRDAFLFVID